MYSLRVLSSFCAALNVLLPARTSRFTEVANTTLKVDQSQVYVVAAMFASKPASIYLPTILHAPPI